MYDDEIGLTPQQKIQMALMAQRGIQQPRTGWGGGLAGLGQSGLTALGMYLGKQQPQRPGAPNMNFDPTAIATNGMP